MTLLCSLGGVSPLGAWGGSSSGWTIRTPAPLPWVLSPGRPSRAGAEADKRSLFERVVEFLSPGPDSRDELIETLAEAEQRSLIEP